MPAQKPGRSVQEVQTPTNFLVPVEERFGRIRIDLAANEHNAVTGDYFGPGSQLGDDAMAHEWCAFSPGLCWLNPPFGKIEHWARKCVEQSALGARIAMLVPASVGAGWFNRWVRPYAYVLELAPRLIFVGHKYQYPKDLILAYYSYERLTGREAWHWAKTKAPANDNAIDPRQMALPIMGGAAG